MFTGDKNSDGVLLIKHTLDKKLFNNFWNENKTLYHELRKNVWSLNMYFNKFYTL